MPLELGAVNGVNAVLFVGRDRAWHEPVADLMRGGGVAEGEIDRWLELLERRVRGEHDWREVLAGRHFPDGRACPPVRLYNDALRGDAPPDEAALVPLLSVPPLLVALDVWGAGERGGEPGTFGLELVVHRDVVHPWRAGATLADDTVVTVSDPDHYARLALYGDAFGELVGRACERLRPVYALCDGMQPVTDFLARARPARLRHPAPAGARLADFAWALTYWSPERVSEDLRERLARLVLPVPRPAWPDGVAISVWNLEGGGLFLQARHILGSELRSSRASLETPLAQQLGLRSNHLLLKR